MGAVPVWQACLWGLLGAGLVEAAEMWRLSRQMGRFPWTADGVPQVSAYLVALGLRLFMAAGLSAAYAAAGQVAGSLAALTLGITAPMVIQQLADHSPQPPGRPKNAHADGAEPPLPLPTPATLDINVPPPPSLDVPQRRPAADREA